MRDGSRLHHPVRRSTVCRWVQTHIFLFHISGPTTVADGRDAIINYQVAFLIQGRLREIHHVAGMRDFLLGVLEAI